MSETASQDKSLLGKELERGFIRRAAQNCLITDDIYAYYSQEEVLSHLHLDRDDWDSSPIYWSEDAIVEKLITKQQDTALHLDLYVLVENLWDREVR